MKISKSKINTYKQCPRKFKYIYIDHLESETNDYMQLGLDVHKNAENVGAILKNKENIIEEDVQQAFEDGYVSSDYVISDHMTSLYDFFVNVIIDSGYKIVNVEDNITDPELGIRGIVDLVLEDPNDGNLIVIDYKTSKSKPITDFRIELCIYKKLVEFKYPGKTVVSACIFFTKDGQYRGVNFVESQKKGSYITQEDIDTVLKYVEYVKEKVKGNNFSPKKQFLCQYCSFEDICNRDGGF